MWSSRNGFFTPPSISKSRTGFLTNKSFSERKPRIQYSSPSNPDNFHVIHKVPHGDSPYVLAKHVQMVEKDPGKAISLFWNAINSGDRVDSALKDMAAVMKQLNRPDEAVEAIRSFRHLCPADSQESIDNVLVELYKRSGRLEEEIEVLLLKLKRVEEASSFVGKIRMGRSHGKRIPMQPQQEYARLLGNLAWAYLQLNEYRIAEEYYRKALSIVPDRNQQCNLAICLMCMNNITEAKFLLQSIQASARGKMDESYAKSYERASDLLAEIEFQSAGNADTSFYNEDEKENHCGRRNAWNADTPPIPPRKLPRTPLSQAKRDTPLIPPGKYLISPFTQPRTDSRLSDTDYWRKGTHRHEPMSHLPRRLQFDKPAEPEFHPPTDDNRSYRETHQQRSRNMTSDPSSVTKVYGSRTVADINPKENAPETDRAGDTIKSYKGIKSWADMAEEDEIEQHKHNSLPGEFCRLMIK